MNRAVRFAAFLPQLFSRPLRQFLKVRCRMDRGSEEYPERNTGSK